MADNDVGLCSSHPSQLITYMCCDSACFQCLCIQCIPEHCQKHISLKSYADIQLLAAVKEKCKKKVEEGMNLMSSLEHELGGEEVKKAGEQQGEESDENILSLLKSREDLLLEVENYFKALISNYKEYKQRSKHKKSPLQYSSWVQYKDNLQNFFSKLSSESSLDKECVQQIYSVNVTEKVTNLHSDFLMSSDPAEPKEKPQQNSLVFVDRTFIHNPLKELLRNFVTILVPCEEARKKSSEISDLGMNQISEKKAKEISKSEYDQFLSPGEKKFVRTSSIIKEDGKLLNANESIKPNVSFKQPEQEFSNLPKIRVWKLNEAVKILTENQLDCHLIIDLNCNKIGNDGVKDLAEALKLNNVIKSISFFLSGNEISSEGIELLSRAVRGNTSIVQMDLFLGSNLIGDAGALSLSNTFRDHKSLRILNLSLYEYFLCTEIFQYVRKMDHPDIFAQLPFG